MSTVEQLGDRWPKVLSGLSDAKVAPEDVKSITAAINSLTLDQAKEAVPAGFSKESGQEQKARRDLYRAAHCLWYLAYRSDKSLAVVGWQTFHDARSSMDTLRKIVQDLVRKALGKDELAIAKPDSDAGQVSARPAVVVRTQFDALKSFQNAAKTVRAQVHAQREATITPVQMARKVLTPQSVVSTLQAQGQARQARASALLASSQEAIARQYFLKLFDLHAEFTDQKLDLLFNFTATATAVETAYKSFDKDVRAGQQEMQSKLDLAKTFFTALAKAPPPLSFVGSIGGAVVGQLHVDKEIDQRGQHEVLRGDAANPIVSSLKDKFTALSRTLQDKTRVGVVLGGIERAGDLQKALHIVAAKYYSLIRNTVKEVCEDTFGGSSQDRERKFQLFLENVRTRKLGTLGGELTTQRLQDLAMREADTLHKETAAAISSTLGAAKVPLPEPDDLVGAIELMLYGSYVLNAFRKEDKTASSGYTYNFSASLPDAIVKRLASASTEWAVLATDITKQQADRKTRLKWEDRENHKRALCYFFEWYRSEMNPFFMMAGVMIKGQPVTGEYIKVQVMEYITRLNKAIMANAKKEHIYSIRTTWNWSEIDIAMGRTQRLDPVLLNAELAALRGQAISNFHSLQ